MPTLIGIFGRRSAVSLSPESSPVGMKVSEMAVLRGERRRRRMRMSSRENFDHFSTRPGLAIV